TLDDTISLVQQRLIGAGRRHELGWNLRHRLPHPSAEIHRVRVPTTAIAVQVIALLRDVVNRHRSNIIQGGSALQSIGSVWTAKEPSHDRIASRIGLRHERGKLNPFSWAGNHGLCRSRRLCLCAVMRHPGAKRYNGDTSQNDKPPHSDLSHRYLSD